MTYEGLPPGLQFTSLELLARWAEVASRLVWQPLERIVHVQRPPNALSQHHPLQEERRRTNVTTKFYNITAYSSPLDRFEFIQNFLQFCAVNLVRNNGKRIEKLHASIVKVTKLQGNISFEVHAKIKCMEQHTSFIEFLKKFPVRRFQKGEMIVCEGLAPRKSYVVKNGFAKVFLTTRSGEEKAVSFVTSHDLFPLTWIFGKSDVSLYYYQAYTNCDMVEVPREELIQRVEEDPQMMRRVLEYVIDLDVDLMQHIHSLEQAKASDKLMHAFNFLTRRFGKRITKSRTRMLLPLTQQDLANFLGLTRETTGAQLKKLQRDGVINYEHQQYVVHTERLRTLLEG